MPNATGAFKTTINNYLQGRAAADPLFAETLKKENKNLDDCIAYIFREVQKSGCNGFDDAEIFGMAVHYYDEDSITVTDADKKSTGRVVVNHHVELPAEDKAEAHKAALDKAIAEEQARMTKKPIAKKPVTAPTQPSLF